MTSRLSPAEIATTIVQRDPAFGPYVRAIGPPPTRRSAPVAQRFSNLARSVTFQLLATKAATTIHARVIDLCDGHVDPEAIGRVGHERLRGAGLSNAKAAAMLDLAARAQDGRLQLHRHGRMSDHDVLVDVVDVRGFGPWSAQMYLMHTLGRHDVWPPGDFGVRNGWSLVHGLDEMITESELRAAGELFAGVRSDVAWYCWRALEVSRAK